MPAANFIVVDQPCEFHNSNFVLLNPVDFATLEYGKFDKLIEINGVTFMGCAHSSVEYGDVQMTPIQKKLLDVAVGDFVSIALPLKRPPIATSMELRVVPLTAGIDMAAARLNAGASRQLSMMYTGHPCAVGQTIQTLVSVWHEVADEMGCLRMRSTNVGLQLLRATAKDAEDPAVVRIGPETQFVFTIA